MVYLKNGISLSLMADILFVSLIVPLVFIDLEHQLLPNAITYPGLLLMVLLRLLVDQPIIDSLPTGRFGLTDAPDWVLTLVGSLLGALAGGGTLWIVRELYLRFRGIEGMGLGDVKMMLMVGAFLGWKLTILTIFVASLLGSIVGIIVMLIRGGTMKMKIPFGVFLGPGSLISLFVGQRFIDWYVSMYR
jgi:leader peptidase (prepilin peptidase)/N-methyltransferase